MNELLSVANGEIYTSEILINKSRFLCFVKHITDATEAENFVAEKRQEFSDARHICFAYRLQNSGKLSDDGEPSGTAGMPIMEVLEKQGLYDIIAVVVRYFGGVKLGAGGLLRAYTGAVTECLGNAKKVLWERAKIYEKTMEYKYYKPFINSIKNRKISVLYTNFGNGATVKFVASLDENINDAKEIKETMFAFD